MYLADEWRIMDGMEGSRETWRLGHRPALDGLRAMAALLVVATHAGALLLPESAPTWHRVSGGGYGVDLFFVLSGFLITTLLLEQFDDRGGIALGRFYARRARRLLPASLTVLAASAGLSWLLGISPKDIGRSVFVVLTYTTNYYKGSTRDVMPGVGHFWSLAVEEQFYLLWPVVLILLLKLRIRDVWIAGGALAVAALVAVNRAALLSDHPFVDVAYRTDAHSDGLLLGVALSILWRRGLIPARFFRLGIAGLVGFLGLALIGNVQSAAGADLGLAYSVAGVLSVAMILGGLDHASSMGRIFSGRSIRHLGRISYGIYLWHVLVIVLLQECATAWPVAIQVVSAFMGSIGLAALSFKFIEQPILRGRRGTALADLGEREPRGADVERTSAATRLEVEALHEVRDGEVQNAGHAALDLLPVGGLVDVAASRVAAIHAD